jgi:hypothetical protein
MVVFVGLRSLEVVKHLNGIVISSSHGVSRTTIMYLRERNEYNNP